MCWALWAPLSGDSVLNVPSHSYVKLSGQRFRACPRIVALVANDRTFRLRASASCDMAGASMHLTCQVAATIACQMPTRNDIFMMHALVSPLRTDFGKINVMTKTRRGGREWLSAKVAGQDDNVLRDLVSATRDPALMRQLGFVQDRGHTFGEAELGAQANLCQKTILFARSLLKSRIMSNSLYESALPGAFFRLIHPSSKRAPGHGGHLGGGCGEV